MDKSELLKTFTQYESNVRSYIHSFPAVFTKAKGSHIWDTQGKQYLDFFAGAGTLNYGHNNPIFKEALITYIQEDGVTHGLDMATQTKETFIKSFISTIVKPRSLSYKIQFPGPTGANAVESALKLARLYTGRRNVIAFTNAFHGVTLGALATTANSKFRDASGTGLGDVTFFPYCNYLPSVDSLALLEKTLDDSSSGVDYPAAVIVETIQGEGGINVASASWLKRLETICKKRSILLIIDDIQAGCGRSGTFFSFEPCDLTPDIVTLSKSLSGYGLPLSVVLIKPELDIWKPGQHNGTFRGNNLAFVTAQCALETYWHNDEFSHAIHKKSQLLQQKLKQMIQRLNLPKSSLRGKGLMIGMDVQDPKLADCTVSEAFTRGLILETSGSTGQIIKLLPPLTITDSELESGLEIIEQALSTSITQTARAG